MSYIDWRRVGFLIPDTRFTPANEVTADAVGDEASPRAGGIAEPDSATARLVIEATGDQDTDLVLQVEQGGFPQLGAGVRYSYRTSAEASTARRGWNAPNLITGWTAAAYSATVNTMVCAIGMANGQVLTAYRSGSTTGVIGTYTPDTNTFTAGDAFPATVHATGCIALAQSPEGYVHLLFRESVTGQWRIYRYSVVDAVTGGSWILHATDMFDTEPGTAATNARLLILPTGEWAFFYAYSNAMWQYASNNQGCTLTRIVAGTPTAARASEAVLTASGKIMVLVDDSTNLTAYVFASAYTPYSSVTGVTVFAAAGADDVWVAADPAGQINVYFRTNATSYIVPMLSRDDGATWVQYQHNVLGAPSINDANTYITAGQGLFLGGAVWLCHQFSDATETEDGSVCLMKLGGFSSITAGVTYSSGFGQTADDFRWAPGVDTVSYARGRVLIPIATPTNTTGFTVTGAGTPSTTAGRVQIATSANTYYWDHSTTPAAGDSAMAMVRWNMASAGSATAHNAGLKIRLTSTSDYEIGIYLTSTSFVVYDVIAGSALATITTATNLDFDVFVDFRPNSYLYVGYKDASASTWTEAYEGGATTGAASTGRYIRWGTSNSSTTTHSYRFAWSMSINSTYAVRMADQSSSATYNQIIGRLLTARPASIDKRSAYGRKQTYIRGKDGPGRITETFQARTRSEFARENVMWQQAPSPRTVYKSTSYVTGQAMAWQPAAGVNTSLGSKTIAMCVLNTNAPVHKLWGDPDDGGGYDLLGTLTLFTGFGALTFIRTGNVIRINGGDAGSRFVMENEFVGASINLAGTKARRIDRHTSGVWNTTGRQVEIVIATSGEGAYDGTEASSGTCWIYAHSGVLVIPGVSNDYKKFMWEATGGESVTDTAYRTGKVLIGGVMVMGQQWDWGYTSEFAVPVVDTETRPGVTRRSAIGPSARTWGVSWTEGVDQIQIRQASTTSTPDFLASDSMGTYPEATRGDVPFLLAGLLAQTRGGEVPVVVLPKLPTAETSITDPTLFLYGRMGPEVRIENVQGSEGEDEVYRVPTITVREIT